MSQRCTMWRGSGAVVPAQWCRVRHSSQVLASQWRPECLSRLGAPTLTEMGLPLRCPPPDSSCRRHSPSEGAV